MLEYHVVENLLTPNPNDGMAQVVNLRSYTDDEIADQMLKRGTLLTKADILAVLQVYREVIMNIVEDGGAINTALFNTTPSMPGVYDGTGDSYDPARHRIQTNIHPGTSLREATKRIKVKKVQVADPIPNIVEVKDVVSGSVNENLTRGSVVQLRGSRLKFILKNEDNGIFLLSENGGEIKLTVVVENKPARLIAMLPADLAQGTHLLEVRTTYSPGVHTEGKQLKTGRFIKPLTVL
jgi:hypothetical protein